MTQPSSTTHPDVWTETDLDLMPDDGCRHEIIDGSLHVTPLATDEHQSIEGNLYVALRAAAPAGWRVLTQLGVRVMGGNLVPDIAVLKPDSARGVHWRDASDVALVVEIASPTTEKNDRGSKLLAYAEAGIPSYWRVARDGTVIVHALVDVDQYGIVATVRPNTTWTARQPFDMVIDPTTLVSDV